MTNKEQLNEAAAWLEKEGYPITMVMTRDNLENILIRYAQWQLEQKQVVSDEEIEKLAEKEFPMQSRAEFYEVERDEDFTYYDYGCMVRNDRRQFIKGFKSALQYSAGGVHMKAKILVTL